MATQAASLRVGLGNLFRIISIGHFLPQAALEAQLRRSSTSIGTGARRNWLDLM
jgi:hypothetical protein